MKNIFCILAICLLTACTGIKANVVSELKSSEGLMPGEGAVLMHAIHKGGLMPTKWVKVGGARDVKKEFTFYRTKSHRKVDSLTEYDLVVVPEGTYVLYAAYVNCLDGERSDFTGFDEDILSEVKTALGMVANVSKWNRTGRDVEHMAGFGWGWSPNNRRGNVGYGVGVNLGGNYSGPVGDPLTSCSIYSDGMNAENEVLLAKITVKSGEIVYAGELDYEIYADINCIEKGNWNVEQYKATYCGVQAMDLVVTDKFDYQAKPYLIAKYGSDILKQTVVRLAEPGVLVNIK